MFYLSEHTAIQESLTANRKKVNHQKPQMDMDEITSIINEAVSKNKQVAIQVEEVDFNGHYNDDVVGLVSGGDEMVYILVILKLILMRSDIFNLLVLRSGINWIEILFE